MPDSLDRRLDRLARDLPQPVKAKHLISLAVGFGLFLIALAVLPNVPALKVAYGLWRGNQHFAQREYGAALRHYAWASAVSPGDARPHVMAGEALREAGELSRAVEQFQLALALDSAGLEAMVGLARATAAQGKPGLAASYLKQASEAKSSDALLQMDLAHALAAQGELQGAREALDVAQTSTRPGSRLAARAHLMLALAVAADDPPLALMHLRQYEASASDDGKSKLAAESLRSALQLDWQDSAASASYAALLGYGYLQVDWLVPARVQLESALVLRPDYGDAATYLGYVYFRQQSIPEALSVLDRAIALQPASPLPHYFAGLALREQRRFDEAAVALRAAVDNSPGDGALWRELARTFVAIGDYPSAADSYEDALLASPGDAQLALDAAAFYLDHLFRIERGVELARQAHESVPNDVRVAEVYARARQVKGDLQGAVDVLAAASREYPGAALLQLRLGELQEALGNRDLAERHYRRAIDLDAGAIAEEALSRCTSLLVLSCHVARNVGEGRAMGAPVKVSDSTFEDQVIGAGLPVLVDFWAPWCGPCKMIAPILDQVATEYDSKLIVAKLDVDENPVTTQKFAVMSIPTMILFKQGQPVERLAGYKAKGDLVKALTRHLE